MRGHDAAWLTKQSPKPLARRQPPTAALASDKKVFTSFFFTISSWRIVRFQVNDTHIIGAKISCIKSFQPLALCRVALWSTVAHKTFTRPCVLVSAKKTSQIYGLELWATCWVFSNKFNVSKLVFKIVLFISGRTENKNVISICFRFYWFFTKFALCTKKAENTYVLFACTTTYNY